MQNNSRNPNSQNGFTLVITVSMMVLLAMICLGLLSLSSISLRTSGREQFQATARANARMAMMLAIGELQKELGPDRRINCQAGMDPTALAEQRQWLAVYDSWNATETARPDPTTRFRRYLVSGDRNILQTLSAASTRLGGKTIDLVGRNTAGVDGRVNVGLMSLANSSGNAGNYGYWIGDENSKAKVNAGRDIPRTVTDELLAIEAGQSAPGVGFRVNQGFQGLTQSGRASWEMGDALRAKSLSLASAELLPGINGSLDLNYHDISTTSYGLLTDVRNGGMKSDLSLYLEQPYTDRLRQPLYTVNQGSKVNFTPDSATTTTLNEFSGITMEELWIYYNLYKEVTHTRPAVNDVAIGRRPARFPTLLSGNSREAVVADRFYPYKRRVYSQVKYMLSLAAEASTTQPGKFDLRLAIDPVVVLWNPYNVALEYQTGGFTTIGFSGLPYVAEFQITNGNSSSTSVVNFSNLFPNGSVNLIPAVLGRDAPIILQPGESRVFSRSAGKGDSLAAGWRYTEGTLLKEINAANSTLPRNLDANARVRLTLRPDAGGFVNYLTFWFGLRSQSPALQSGTFILQGDRRTSDLPTVSTPQTLTVANIIADRKIPHMLISQNMRAENDTISPSKSWLWSNPSILFRQAADNSPATRLAHQMDLFVTAVHTWENPYVQITPDNQAYWGGGTRADFGVPFFTMRGVPLTPMKSIAAFQHSCANGMRRHWKNSNVSVPAGSFPPTAEGLDGHRYLSPMGSKLIGNSFAHPMIPASSTSTQASLADAQAAPPVAATVPLADHSYLANAALWDSWYFSSLAPQTVHPYRSNQRSLQQVFDGFYPLSTSTTPVPLPTARFTPYRPGNDTLLRTLMMNGNADPTAYQKIAAYMMVDGAFNVNSVSVNAWKVILASLRDHATTRMDSGTGGLVVVPAETDSTPVNGLGTANGDSTQPSANPAERTQWNGFRRLSDGEIDRLANELVNEIRLRGPFLCLSDFINRRPGSNSDLSRQGALQSAIEKAQINGALDQGARALGAVPGAVFSDAARGSRAAGIPAFMTQADLLTPLGPILQARSDTFTIRAYGNATDSFGNVLAEAWCEAVVQRTPDFIDPIDASATKEIVLRSAVNRAYGRKYRLISYRLLNRNEV